MRWALFFDGLCEPKNPGGTSTYGFVAINTDTGEVQHEGFGFVARGAASTNNVAEYAALVRALEYVLGAERKPECLDCHGDSMLVVNQVSGVWRCNYEHLRRGRDKVRALTERLENSCVKVTLGWVPRAKNAHADALSRRAYREATGMEAPSR